MSDESTGNREKIGKGRPPKKTRFSKENQPEKSGRPKKMLSAVNDELKELGYELIKPSHLAEGFQLILNLDETEIKKLATEKKMPIFVRILARKLIDKNMDYLALNDILNRIIGKPKGSLDVTTGGEKLTTIDPKQLSTETLKEILKAKRNAESE